MNLLAGDRRRPRAIPGAFDVRPKGQQAIPLGSIQRDGRASGERISLGFNCASYLQVLIPAPFEFTGDQAIVRIDRVVLSLRAGHFVARLLECEFDLPKFLAKSRPAPRPRRSARPQRRAAAGAGSPQHQRRGQCASRRTRCTDRRHDSDARHGSGSARRIRSHHCRRRAACGRNGHSAAGLPAMPRHAAPILGS